LSESIDAIIEGAFVVELTQLPEERAGEKILWGYVVQDGKGRFVPGDYVCTTTIMSSDGARYCTRNSVYLVEGVIKNVALHYRWQAALRSGLSPDECLLSEVLRKKEMH